MKRLGMLTSCLPAMLLLCVVLTSTDSAAVGPGPDACPLIMIDCSPNGCCGPKYTFAVNIQGGDPDREPSFKWSVSAGTITEGQGTSAIEVDAGGAGDKPLTVTVEIGNIIPEGCDRTKSYTTKCDGAVKASVRGRSCKGRKN
jgi:PKD-like domain